MIPAAGRTQSRVKACLLNLARRVHLNNRVTAILVVRSKALCYYFSARRQGRASHAGARQGSILRA